MYLSYRLNFVSKVLIVMACRKIEGLGTRSRNAPLRFQLDICIKACAVRSYHKCLSHGKSRGRNEHAGILMLLTNNEIYLSQLICSFILLNLPSIRVKANPHFPFLFASYFFEALLVLFE